MRPYSDADVIYVRAADGSEQEATFAGKSWFKVRAWSCRHDIISFF